MDGAAAHGVDEATIGTTTSTSNGVVPMTAHWEKDGGGSQRSCAAQPICCWQVGRLGKNHANQPIKYQCRLEAPKSLPGYDRHKILID